MKKHSDFAQAMFILAIVLLAAGSGFAAPMYIITVPDWDQPVYSTGLTR